jgi:hypothetical protein
MGWMRSAIVVMTFLLPAWPQSEPFASPHYAGFFGGELRDTGTAIVAIPSGGYYAAGTTASRQGIFAAPWTGNRIFLARFDANHRQLWIQILPGFSVTALQLDRTESAYLLGRATSEAGLVPASALFPTPASNLPFIAKFDAEGARVWATYFGALTGHSPATLSISPSGRVGICGYGRSDMWPLLPSAPVTAPPVFSVAASCSILSSDGQRLKWSSALSPLPIESFVLGTAFDEQERLHVVGESRSWGYPLLNEPPAEDPRRSLFRLLPSEDTWQPLRGPDTGNVVWLEALTGTIYWSNASGFHSTSDGGKTVTSKPAPSGRFVVHPLNSRFVCMLTPQLNCSSNSGDSWFIRSFSSDISSLVADPNNEGIFFAVISGRPERISLIPGPIPPLQLPASVVPASAIHATGHADSPVLLIASFGRSFRSTDGGASFEQIQITPDGHQSYFSSPGANPVIYALKRVQPDNQSMLQRSLDGGLTWTDTGPPRTEFEVDGTGFGQIDLAVHPSDPMRLILNHRSGTWQSTDGATTWRSLHADLPNRNVQALAYSPDGALYAATSLGGSAFVLTIDPERNAIEPRSSLSVEGLITWKGIAQTPQGGYWLFAESTSKSLPFEAASLASRTPHRRDGFLVRTSPDFQIEAAYSTGQYFSAHTISPLGQPTVVVRTPAANTLFTLNPDGTSTMQRSLFLPTALAISSTNSIYLWGTAFRNNLTPTPNAIQPQNAGDSDAAIVELPPL